jgi:large subunit ribosomal protein L15
MPVRSKKFRGRRTHGQGLKASRGKGKRGGHGNAGGHKHKWIGVVQYAPDHFGVHGFKRPEAVKREIRAINVGDLERMIPDLVSKGSAKAAGKGYDVDLAAAGIDKLLGSGRISIPVTVKVESASQHAKEKVGAAGGKVVEP